MADHRNVRLPPNKLAPPKFASRIHGRSLGSAFAVRPRQELSAVEESFSQKNHHSS